MAEQFKAQFDIGYKRKFEYKVVMHANRCKLIGIGVYTHIMSPNFRRVWANANVSGPLPAATRLRLPNACVPGGNDGGGACAPLFLVTPSPMMAMLSSSPKTLVFVKRAIGDEPLLRRAPTPPSILVWREITTWTLYSLYIWYAQHLLHMNSGFLAEINAKNSVQSATQTCSHICAN